jgi:DHA3 family macrolide efflux protein-like MFS transporter
VTFIVAIGALLLVQVPQPPKTEEGQKGSGSLWKEAAYGFQYIVERPSLLGMQLVFLTANFFISIPNAIMAPMILARSGNDSLVFGSVNSAGAVGGFIGGLVMSAWGGPKRRVHGVLVGWIFSGLLGAVLLGLGQAVPVWVAASFLGALVGPVVNGSNQAIWQSKVAPDIQGRVFSIRRLVAWFVAPLSMLIAGPLADQVLEPAMQDGGSLVGVFKGLVGSGPGAGMGLMFVVFGTLAACVGLAAYAFRPVRLIEDLLPDHDALTRQQDPG